MVQNLVISCDPFHGGVRESVIFVCAEEMVCAAADYENQDAHQLARLYPEGNGTWYIFIASIATFSHSSITERDHFLSQTIYTVSPI